MVTIKTRIRNIRSQDKCYLFQCIQCVEKQKENAIIRIIYLNYKHVNTCE